jgi:uncharacterized protein YbjT (DUF2867 family)
VAIGVTGATGGVGSRVLRRLLARPELEPVVALARRPDAVPRAPGLTVRHADYDDPASLRAALAGLGSLVFVSSDGQVEPMRRHHRHVVAAAMEAGVEHVVYTSIIDVAPDSRFYYSAPHRETEALLAGSGIALPAGLRYVPLEEPDYRERLAAEGAPEWLVEAYSSMFASVREGRFERVAAGPPQPFREFFRQAVDPRVPRSS